jgi:hypothetical protein
MPRFDLIRWVLMAYGAPGLPLAALTLSVYIFAAHFQCHQPWPWLGKCWHRPHGLRGSGMPLSDPNRLLFIR